MKLTNLGDRNYSIMFTEADMKSQNPLNVGLMGHRIERIMVPEEYYFDFILWFDEGEDTPQWVDVLKVQISRPDLNVNIFPY